MSEKKVAGPQNLLKDCSTYLEFMGMGAVRIARLNGNGVWQYLPCLPAEDGDNAYLGSPELGEYKLELWLKPEIQLGGSIEPLVYNKWFYTPEKKKREMDDLRKTDGRFHKKFPWKYQMGQGKHMEVYTQKFEVKESYKTEDANYRNLYLVLCGHDGLTTFTFTIYQDVELNRFHLVVGQVWTGAVRRKAGKFWCHTLQRQWGGSRSLTPEIQRFYERKLGELKEVSFKEEMEAKKVAEKIQTGHLKAWAMFGVEMGPEDDPNSAEEIEVFTDMSSEPRWMTFGRDRWGSRQVYLNWKNFRPAEDFPETGIRRIPVGVILRCKVRRDEDYISRDGNKIPLWRAEEIRMLSKTQTKARLAELAKDGDKYWVSRHNWWEDVEVDSRQVVEEMMVSQPVVARPPRRRRQFIARPEPKVELMRFPMEMAFNAVPSGK